MSFLSIKTHVLSWKKRLGSKVHKCTSYKLIIALKKMWKEWFTGGWKRQFWMVEKFTQLLVDKGVDEGVKWKVLQRVIRGKTERFINVPATSWQKHWRRCQKKGSLESERGNVESLEKSTYLQMTEATLEKRLQTQFRHLIRWWINWIWKQKLQMSYFQIWMIWMTA